MGVGVGGVGVSAPKIALPAMLQRGGEPVSTTMELARSLLTTLAGGQVTVDVEHSGYPIGHVSYFTRTYQLGTADWAIVLDAQDPEARMLACQVLDAASEIVTFVATADTIPIAIDAGRTTDTWWHKTTDVQSLAALTEPARIGIYGDNLKSLKDLAETVVPGGSVAKAAAAERAKLFRKNKWLTNVDVDTNPDKSGWANYAASDPVMVRYAASDVLDAAASAHNLVTRFGTNTAPALVQRERIFQAAVSRVAERGLLVDAAKAEQVAAKLEQEQEDAAAKLLELGFTEPTRNMPVAARFTELGARLPSTPKGAPSVDKDALISLAEAAPGSVAAEAAELLLEHRQAGKAASNWVKPIRFAASHGDGRIRPTVYPLGAAATGRSSATRPNIGNFPKQGGVRSMVVADPGHVFINADFSGVEVRVAAYVSGDVYLARLIRDGLDLHDVVAAAVWGERFTKAQRYAAKRVVFGKFYGAGDGALRRQMGAENAAALPEVKRALAEATPGFTAWGDQLIRDVKTGTKKYAQHPSGRRTYFPKKLAYKAINYSIQSAAREILCDSVTAWEQKHPGTLLVPIYDELLIPAPEAQAEEWQADLLDCMTTRLPMPDGTFVPIVAEPAPILPYWADAA